MVDYEDGSLNEDESTSRLFMHHPSAIISVLVTAQEFQDMRIDDIGLIHYQEMTCVWNNFSSEMRHPSLGALNGLAGVINLLRGPDYQ